MSAAIFDFETIAKHARLKALDGTPQNVVQPMVVTAGPDPVEFDGYGMYALCGSPASSGSVTLAQADLPTLTLGNTAVFFYDTAPSEWSAPEQDPA